MTYTIVRERVTWIRWDPKALRNRTSHPTVWTVQEDGVDVYTADTKRDAEAWIAAQGPAA
jgi:hypothetical protein